MASGRISCLQVQGQLQALMNRFRVISNPRAAYVSKADFDQELNLANKAVVTRMKRLIYETVEMKEW